MRREGSSAEDAKTRLWAQRYYGTGETTVALRSNADGDSELSYLVADKHRTATLAIDAGDEQTFVKRSLSPFGAGRTAAGVGEWVDDKAFLGKTRDTTTGLTHIGAREYDPGTGMFLSVDPLLELDKPQTLNGYSYAAQNPYTFTDPTGMGLACGGAGRSHIGCGTGTVTHADGSLSKNGNPTGGGIIKGGGALTHGTPPGGCAAVRCHSGGGPGQAYRANQPDGQHVKMTAEQKGFWNKIGGEDNWRGLTEATAFGVCVAASLKSCAIAGAIVLALKYGADAYTHDRRYANGRLKPGLRAYIIGLAIGGLGGRVMRARWRIYAKETGRGIAPLRARHAKGGGRHVATPSKSAQRMMYGGNVFLGQLGCGTTWRTPIYC